MKTAITRTTSKAVIVAWTLFRFFHKRSHTKLIAIFSSRTLLDTLRQRICGTINALAIITVVDLRLTAAANAIWASFAPILTIFKARAILVTVYKMIKFESPLISRPVYRERQ